MKKNIILIICIIIFSGFIISSFADEEEDKTGYELYEERVEKICKQYEPTKKIFSTENFKNTKNIKFGTPFDNAKDTYKENMNNIYKCMILNSQKASLTLINNDLIKNNPELKKLVSKKIESKLNKIEISFNTLKCMDLGEENNSIQKLKLLDQTTFELCKYHSYLEYLREYNSDYNNIEIPDNGSKNTTDLLQIERERKTQIDNEIEHIYKVFPIAFAAYKQYEDNLATHLLLELIKEDYIALRESLHGSLNPINQVVYKIANAMKK